MKNVIDHKKLNTFNSHMNFYRQKNHMTHRDFVHVFNIANQNLTPYEIWKNDHEIDSIVDPIEKPLETIFIDFSMNSINDLISIVDKYPVLPNTKYNIDLKMLHSIHAELKELNSMIGITLLKSAILDQLLYYVQGFHLHGLSDDYKHTVLYGPPGSGKTEIAKIIGRMYSKMGIIKKPPLAQTKDANTPFKKITRSDLVAGYLGQTALKTRGVINDSLGGVIFLDEAYSLGHKDGGDSFSKECADTLCESLSNHRESIMFIIAGYEKELDSNFFALNPGLESRFVWRFKIDNYTYDELWQIFLHKVNSSGWTCDDALSQKDGGKAWFKTKFEHFTGLGRDVDTLLFKTKISHSRANYGKEVKYELSVADLNAGFNLFMKSKSGNAEIEKRERKRISDSLYI